MSAIDSGWIGMTECVPHSNHIVVHLLQLLLGCLESVGGWVELISLEGLVGKLDIEWLVVLL
jgi:hypothetical protein